MDKNKKQNQDMEETNDKGMDQDISESGTRGGRTKDTGNTSDLETDLGMEDFEDMGRDEAL